MYGADILIFEGILSFHRPEIAVLMDMKVSADVKTLKCKLTNLEKCWNLKLYKLN